MPVDASSDWIKGAEWLVEDDIVPVKQLQHGHQSNMPKWTQHYIPEHAA